MLEKGLTSTFNTQANLAVKIQRACHAPGTSFRSKWSRHLETRVMALAISFLKTAEFFLRLADGLSSLGKGSIKSIKERKLDKNTFSIECAKNYFKKLGKCALGAAFGSFIGFFVHPQIAKKHFLSHIYGLDPTNPKDTDAVINRTDQWIIDKLYETFEVVDEVLSGQKIKYSLHAGTLLGARRHNGIIPWDDDGDMVVLPDDYERIKNLKDVFAANGYGMSEWWGGLKIYPLDGKKYENRDDLPWLFPFVDISPVKEKNGELVHGLEAAYKGFPKERFLANAWSKIERVPFGHLKLLCIPREDQDYFCNNAYGSDWDQIVYQIWDHENETGHNRRKVLLTDRSAAPYSKKTT